MDTIVDPRFQVKLPLENEQKSPSCIHAETVCVDRNLLCVGSDNPHPHINREHGCWIDNKDDSKPITTFMNGWFDELRETSALADY